ncbi:MAG: diguanylate cyclase, partial [Rhizobium sp.]|nr:diguanylate cyclase [Rhizobium sp.]
MTLMSHDSRHPAPAITRSGSETVELSAEMIREATARTFAPIIRGFLVPVCVFYVVICIPHLVLRAPADAVLQFSLSALTAAVAFFLRKSLRIKEVSFERLEVIGSVVLMLIYANTCALLYVDFHPANLIYFLLLMMLSSTVGISIRVVAGVSAVTLVTMLVFAFVMGREPFFYYSFVSLAGAFCAIGLATLMRGAILKAVRSRLLAERLRERAERQADFDALSGLPNRRSYFANLEQMMAAPDASVHVGIIDLDGFKPVNDLYGHAVGDDLLVEVAARIRNTCPPAYLVARLGGDEFALAIDRPMSQDSLTRLGSAICEALRRPFSISGISIAISGSIGFAHYPSNGETAREIYERADHALYCAKRATRGDVVIFTERHEAEMNDYGLIEQTLRNADLVKELYLDFQPQFDILKQRTSGFEALGRWASPTLGTVSPGLFIAAAERTGMIERVTGILLQKALAAAVTWPAGISLSFNLSPLDLVSPRSIANVMRIVRESGIAPERLTFEITETMVMSDFECARGSLVAL